MPGDRKRVGYRIVLPPGWLRIPLDEKADARGRELVAAVAARAQPQARAEIQRFLGLQLQTALRLARENGGQDFYLPTLPVDGVPLSMSVVVSVIAPPPGASGSASEALLSFTTGDETAEAATLGQQLAIRRHSDADAIYTDGELTTPASRRITYLTTPPGDSRLMLVTASILKLEAEGADEITDAIEFLFDALVRTIRFEPGSTVIADDSDLPSEVAS